MLNSFLLLPFFSVFVLLTAWLGGRLLPKSAWTGWVAILTLSNVLFLYLPWGIAIIVTRHIIVGPITFLGFFMIATALFLLVLSLPPIIQVPGQRRSLPERLVVKGPYQWIRHPMYLSYFLAIAGSALAFGAIKVFLETPILLGLAAIGGRYEESTRLLPQFGQAFEQYKAKTPFLLPAWGWVGLGCIYSWVVLIVSIS